MDDTESDLAETVEELTDTLVDLRKELREPPSGPFGIPRPPRPDELLYVTERYTIPALISLFETSIKTLELLASTIRLIEGRPGDQRVTGDRTAAEGRKQVDRLASASRTTLEKLDDALADLQDAAKGGSADDPEVQRLLDEARELRKEVDERLASAIGERSTSTTDPDPINIDVREKTDDAEEPNENEENADETVDVESELESIKRDAADTTSDDETGDKTTDDASDDESSDDPSDDSSS